jgi:hypothetical protein
VFGEACGEATLAIPLHTEPAHGDGGQQSPLLPIETLEQVSSRTVWQTDIGNENIKVEALRTFKSLCDAGGHADLMTFPGQQKTETFVCVLVIIHDEDPNGFEARSRHDPGRWLHVATALSRKCNNK